MTTEQRPAEKKPLPITKKFLLSVVTTLVLLLFLEGSLRIVGFSFQQAGLQSSTEWGVGPDPALSWSWLPVPNATCNLSKWAFAFKFNALGYRGPVFEKQKPPGTIRIVCMGDSVTMGWRVEDEKTFCSALQQKLASQVKKKVETINAGVMAYTSFQGLHQLQARILDLKPDVIIISYNWDDHSPATTTNEVFGSSESGKARIVPDKEIPNVRGKETPIRVLSKFRTFQLMQLAVSKVLPSQEPKKLETFNTHETLQGIVRVPLADYRSNVEGMIRIAKDHHIIPVLLTEPCGAESKGKLSQGGVQAQPIFNDQYNHAMKEIAAREGVLCVDTIPAFQKEDPSFFDSIHPRQRGHMIIASELASAIVARYPDL